MTTLDFTPEPQRIPKGSQSTPHCTSQSDHTNIPPPHCPGALTGASEIGPDPDDLCPFALASVEVANLPSRSIIDLRPIQQGNHHVSIVEVVFAPGENLFFGPVAKSVHLLLRYQVVWENDFDPGPRSRARDSILPIAERIQSLSASVKSVQRSRFSNRSSLMSTYWL